MLENIRHEVIQRGISRLCHFTSSNNFLHVLQSQMLKDRASLDAEANSVVNPTDQLRLDGHRDKICCSIEFPNAYYLDRVRKNNLVFNDWIIVLLNPELLWRPGTHFCQRNAAAQNGGLIKSGAMGFQELFAQVVVGAGGNRFTRQAHHFPNTPTDAQAEVLIPGPIPFKYITGIIVQNEKQGLTELARWNSLNFQQITFPIYSAPILFDKIQLSNATRSGARPTEIQIKAQ